MEKDDFFKLMQAISARTADPLKDGLLRDEFDMKWPILQKSIEQAIQEAAREDPSDSVESARRPEGEILEDLVSAVRELRQDVQRANPKGWRQIDKAAVLDEVNQLLDQVGVTRTGVEVIGVHSNGLCP